MKIMKRIGIAVAGLFTAAAGARAFVFCMGFGKVEVAPRVTAIIEPSVTVGVGRELVYKPSVEAEVETEEVKYKKMTAYGYCGCEKCRGEWYTASSDGAVNGAYDTELVEGISVAVPALWQEGVAVEVCGYGTYVVSDVCEPWKIGFYFDSHAAAVAFGEREVYVREVTK